MNHDRAVLLVEDYAAGRLTGATNDEMCSHLDACPECRGLVEACALAIEASRRPSSDAGDHPTADAIAAYAMGFKPPHGWTRDGIAAHAATCPSCREEIRGVEEAERDLARTGLRKALARAAAPFAGSWLVPAFATLAVVAVLVAYPVTRGLDRISSQSRRIDELTRRLSAPVEGGAGGVYPLYVLTGTERGSASKPRATVRAAGDAVDLAIAPSLPPSEPQEGLYRIELRGADDRTLWSVSVSDETIRRTSDVSDGLLPVRIPVSVLVEGSARLVMISPSGEAVATYPFTVVSRTPHP